MNKKTDKPVPPARKSIKTSLGVAFCLCAVPLGLTISIYNK